MYMVSFSEATRPVLSNGMDRTVGSTLIMEGWVFEMSPYDLPLCGIWKLTIRGNVLRALKLFKF